MRKNKVQHFLEVNTNTFPPTKQTNEQTIKRVTTGPLQATRLPVPQGSWQVAWRSRGGAAAAPSGAGRAGPSSALPTGQGVSGQCPLPPPASALPRRHAAPRDRDVKYFMSQALVRHSSPKCAETHQLHLGMPLETCFFQLTRGILKGAGWARDLYLVSLLSLLSIATLALLSALP